MAGSKHSRYTYQSPRLWDACATTTLNSKSSCEIQYRTDAYRVIVTADSCCEGVYLTTSDQ